MELGVPLAQSHFKYRLKHLVYNAHASVARSSAELRFAGQMTRQLFACDSKEQEESS